MPMLLAGPGMPVGVYAAEVTAAAVDLTATITYLAGELAARVWKTHQPRLPSHHNRVQEASRTVWSRAFCAYPYHPLQIRCMVHAIARFYTLQA